MEITKIDFYYNTISLNKKTQNNNFFNFSLKFLEEKLIHMGEQFK